MGRVRCNAGNRTRMLRIAVVFSALMALATSQGAEAATPSSAPVSRLVSGPGITVTDQGSPPTELSEAPIIFSKSLNITLTVNSTVNASKCTVTDLTYQWATLQLIDPNGAKSDLGSIDNSDVYGSQDCSGHHSRTKSFSLPGAKGNYVLVLVVNTLVNRRPKSGPYFVYPSIRIEADGLAAIDRSFPSYGDEAQITQVVPIVFK
jgi:hypothetical protein